VGGSEIAIRWLMVIADFLVIRRLFQPLFWSRSNRT
jgi:hypothetical protein